MAMTMMTASASARRTSRLIWHRGRDLRLRDNEMYSFPDLHKNHQELLHHHQIPKKTNRVGDSHENTQQVAGGKPPTTTSLFIFDKKYFHPQPSAVHPYQTVWYGPHAARAMIEAVTNLRQELQSIGGELLVRYGDPTVIVPQLVQELNVTELIFCEEPGTYECQVSQTLRQMYYSNDQHYFGFDLDGDYSDSAGQSSSRVQVINKAIYTLYHPNDLPFHPDEWNQLAHPKQNQKRKGKRKKNNKHTNSSTSSSIPRIHGNDDDSSNIIDISPERFRGMCRIMTDFRTAARSSASVRLPLPSPIHITPHEIVKDGTMKVGTIPTLEELVKPILEMNESESSSSLLGLDRKIIHTVIQSALTRRDGNGTDDHCYPIGEEAGLKHLDKFLIHHAANADRSKADVSKNDSSRFSTHLAFGTLSPRMIYHRAKDHVATEDDENGAGVKWIMSHLEMRDFFLYTAFASGKDLYQKEGLPIGKKKKENPIVWTDPGKSEDGLMLWRRWTSSNTQFPLVDAAMTELTNSGYCSNRVRQNMASFLTKDLNIDWRMGAEWFQFLLEDHCVGANWGNWLYFSGVGPDPKNRHFRTISQSLRYDDDGVYVQKWLPALREYFRSNNDGNCKERRDDALEAMFRPWDYGVSGFDDPVVDPKTQFTWKDLQRLEDTGRLIEDTSRILEND